MSEDAAKGEYPPYKANGMGYIRFTREEKELFKILFTSIPVFSTEPAYFEKSFVYQDTYKNMHEYFAGEQTECWEAYYIRLYVLLKNNPLLDMIADKKQKAVYQQFNNNLIYTGQIMQSGDQKCGGSALQYAKGKVAQS